VTASASTALPKNPFSPPLRDAKSVKIGKIGKQKMPKSTRAPRDNGFGVPDRVKTDIPWRRPRGVVQIPPEVVITRDGEPCQCGGELFDLEAFSQRDRQTLLRCCLCGVMVWQPAKVGEIAGLLKANAARKAEEVRRTVRERRKAENAPKTSETQAIEKKQTSLW
jgi:hypothetical protein